MIKQKQNIFTYDPNGGVRAKSDRIPPNMEGLACMHT